MGQVEHSDMAEAALLRLHTVERERIPKFFRERVPHHPEPKRLAKTLAGPLRGLWRLRIGDYRAICDIQEGKLLVLVLEGGHRGDVYR